MIWYKSHNIIIYYTIGTYTTTRIPKHQIINAKLMTLMSLIRLKLEKNVSKNYNYKSPKSSIRDELDPEECPWLIVVEEKLNIYTILYT